MTEPVDRIALLGALLFLAAACTGGPDPPGPGPEPGPAPDPDPAPPAPRTGTVDVLTYNVAGLPEGISGSSPATYTPLISPLLDAYELVLVQEDFVYHEALAAEASHPFQSEPMAEWSRMMHDGLNRFSIFPFGPLERVRWVACHGGFRTGASDCLADKGFSVADTTLAPGVDVLVYNHHAEAGGGAEDEAAREAGFDQLAEHILANGEGRALIVAGDTNLHGGGVDREVFDRFLARTGLVDACRALDCGRELIDRVLFRSGDGLELDAELWEVPGEFVTEDGHRLSDHRPTRAVIRWTEIAPTSDS